MRTVLVASVLLATLLAGCSGGGGLASHVVQRGDLAEGFTYWPIPQEARDEGLDRNPGPHDVSDFAEFGVVAGYLSAFNYNGGENPVLVSQAMRFENATQRDTFFQQFGGCSEDSYVVASGLVLSMVQALTYMGEDGDEAFLREQAHDAAHAIEVRTGGTSLCEDH